MNSTKIFVLGCSTSIVNIPNIYISPYPTAQVGDAGERGEKFLFSKMQRHLHHQTAAPYYQNVNICTNEPREYKM